MSTKPEIIFVTPRVPAPGIFGDQLRAWHFMKWLAQDYRITLVCLDKSARPEDHPHLTSDIVAEVHLVGHSRLQAVSGALLGMLAGQPAQVGWFTNARLHATLANLAARGVYTAAFVQTSRLAAAVGALGDLPVVMDFVDALSMQWDRRRRSGAVWWRSFNTLESRRLVAVENAMLERCAVCVATGPDDARWLEEHAARPRRVHVVPNGVDMDQFKPLAVRPVNAAPKVLFSGNLDYLPNRQAVLFFAEEALPLLRSMHPAVRFVAAGKLTDEDLRSRGAELGVEFTGFVDDLAAEIASADVAVTPMVSGAGIQNKVLEAMATGTPVVSTRLANAAIGAAHGREILIGASGAALAGHVAALLGDPDLRRSVGAAGRAFVQREFSWQAQADVIGGHLLEAEPVRRSRRASRQRLEHVLDGVPEGVQETVFGGLVRGTHLVVSLLILAVFVPLLPLVALAIKLTSPGSVFYAQERLGIDRRNRRTAPYTGPERRRADVGGRPFTIRKLRTMRSDAEVASGPVWAQQNDPRITPIGRFLRKTRLDEVPQLWNVVRGDMSLVGPRPERPFFAQELTRAFPGYASRLRRIKPGLTGLAQIHAAYDTTIEGSVEKQLLDHAYRLRASRARDRFVTDIEILLMTVPTVLTGKGAR